MTDQAVRARVDGRDAVAKRTIWRLEVGPIKARCLWDGSGFVVQVHGPKGWNQEVGRDRDALALLKAVAASKGLFDAVTKRCGECDGCQEWILSPETAPRCSNPQMRGASK